MRKIGSIYLAAVIWIMLGAVLDYNRFSGEKSIFITYPGELIIAWTSLGLILLILLIILRIQKRIESRIFVTQIIMLMLGMLVPFVFLFLLMSQLQ